jgi:hypothetical protein
MKDAETNYWIECVSIGAEECGASLTADQIEQIAASVQGGHENYGMAFYSPPSSDRLTQIESEWKSRYKELEREFEKYRSNAETAVKRALRQHSDANVSIGEYGEVTRHEGRSERIL